MEGSLKRGLLAIFIVTFILVFTLFFMIEPNLYCVNEIDDPIPQCRVMAISGDFILGLVVVAIMFLLDMAFVYMLLADYLM